MRRRGGGKGGGGREARLQAVQIWFNLPERQFHGFCVVWSHVTHREVNSHHQTDLAASTNVVSEGMKRGSPVGMHTQVHCTCECT